MGPPGLQASYAKAVGMQGAIAAFLNGFQGQA